ncbi:MAG: hypothetical protein ACTSRE_03040 [Promethearchaeota archaeon]
MSEEEEIFDNVDLPSLHRKYLKKIIVFLILCVVFLGWGVFSIVTYASHPDYEDVSIAWGIIYTLSMIIAPIAGMSYLSLTLKNSGLLRKIIHKQKGIEPKDRTKHYYKPDSETIALFKKGDKNGSIYSYITTSLTVAFMIFYWIAYFNVNWIPNLVNLFDDVVYPIVGDILSILGYISSIPIILWIYAIFESITLKRKQKQEKKDQEGAVSFLRSLTSKSKTKNSKEPTEESQNEVDVDLSDSGEYFEDEFEPIDEVKEYINLHNLGWGYNLIWLSCFVIGIPLKIFLPLYLLPMTIELSFVIQIFNFAFWGIFLTVFIVYLTKMIPVWRKIKSLEIKTEKV